MKQYFKIIGVTPGKFIYPRNKGFIKKIEKNYDRK